MELLHVLLGNSQGFCGSLAIVWSITGFPPQDEASLILKI